MSPISSRNSVPPFACRMRPTLPSRAAPVNAPGLWPNSSLSISGSGMAPQFTDRNGFSARRLAAWMARAQYPLPVPVSPSNSTEMSRSMTRRRTSTLCCITGSVECRHCKGSDSAVRALPAALPAVPAEGSARRCDSTGACTIANHDRLPKGERREQLPGHAEDRDRGAGQLEVLGEEMLGAVYDDRPWRRQARPHAVRAQLLLAPHYAFAEPAAARRGRKSGIADVAEDDAIAIGQHDAVLGVQQELAEAFHLDARNRQHGADALPARQQVGMLDAVRPLALIGVQRVGRETAAPRAPYDLIDRQPRPVSGDDTANQVRVALGAQSRLHGVPRTLVRAPLRRRPEHSHPSVT